MKMKDDLRSILEKAQEEYALFEQSMVELASEAKKADALLAQVLERETVKALSSLPSEIREHLAAHPELARR